MNYCLIKTAPLALLSFATATVPVAAQDLKIVMESRLSVLDPILSAAHQTRDHGYLIYDVLFALDAEQNIQPQMVETYEVSEDGRQYTFTLREGLLWHDGSPVTGADVVASIRRWGERDRMGMALMTIVDEMSTPDESTFVVSLTQASELILDAFAKPSGVPLFIMPEAVAQTPVTEAITDYRGSGPFEFVAEEFEPGARALYARNDDYVPRSEEPSWFAGGKIAKVERIERIEMTDPLTSLNALLNGEIDYLQTIPFDLIPLVPEGGPVQSQALDELGYQIGYRFNHLQAPFDNVLTRQAAIWAIGQEEILQTQFGSPDYYDICGAVFGCGLPYENDELAEMVVEANSERAGELLDQSGYDGETVLILHVTDSPTMSSIALVMAQQMREAGFNVELQAMDFMTMLSRRANRGSVAEGGWSIFVTSWHNTEIEDPIRNLMIAAGGEESYAGWADVPELEALVGEFLVAPDQAERERLAREIQHLTYEEGVYAPAGSFARISGFGPNVSGVLAAPATIFWNVSVGED